MHVINQDMHYKRTCHRCNALDSIANHEMRVRVSFRVNLGRMSRRESQKRRQNAKSSCIPGACTAQSDSFCNSSKLLFFPKNTQIPVGISKQHHIPMFIFQCHSEDLFFFWWLNACLWVVWECVAAVEVDAREGGDLQTD